MWWRRPQFLLEAELVMWVLLGMKGRRRLALDGRSRPCQLVNRTC